MNPREPALVPLPVATLQRRARNAKSPRDRHDAAYFAWEVSVRLAVAAHLPPDLAPLARGSVGHWARAVDAGDDPLDAKPILDVYALATEIGAGKRHAARSVSARQLIDALPAYRNQVIGHGSIRSAEFYRDAGGTLIRGLEAAWADDVFLPRGARMLVAESVDVDAEGARRARLLDLSGVASYVVEPRGTAGVPDDLVPWHLYLSVGDAYRSLHPLVLYRADELAEHVLFFNGLRRRAAFLDYASGEPLRGDALEEAFPGLEAELFTLFEQKPDEETSGEDDPDLFGDYRILGKLGEGGMGVVYLARQESLGRLVALKMLPAVASKDATSVARFKREVAALGRCEHPNVIKILASGETNGTHYYAMEYVEGADLSQVARVLSTSDDFAAAISTASERVLEERAEIFPDTPRVQKAAPSLPKRGRDRYRQIAESFRDAAKGLHHLHESGVVHRDVKPANLMVTAADHRVVVMDLGLAAIGDASRSITRDKSQILGTLRYMPPEQLQRNFLQVDHRADVYALGATFYELLTDRPFFDGDTEARLIEQVLREDPLPPRRADPALPDDVATILGKATEKDPKGRYESAAALADDLDAYMSGRPIRARPPTLGYVLKLAIRRNRPLAATVAAAVLLIVALTVFFVDSLATERNRAEDEADEANRQRGRADQRAKEAIEERERAEELANFMLFDLRDGLEPIGRLDLLGKVARKSLAYYAGLPAEGLSGDALRSRGVSLNNVGHVLLAEGDTESALESYRASLEISTRLAARASTDPHFQSDVAICHANVGDVLFDQGDVKAALESYRVSLELSERVAAQNPTNDYWSRSLPVMQGKIGNVLLALGDAESALARFRASLEIAERLASRDPGNPIWQTCLSAGHTNVGDVLLIQGDARSALTSFRTALDLDERLAAQDPANALRQRELSVDHDRIGMVLVNQGDVDAAARSYRASFEIKERLAAQDPTNAVWQRDLSVGHSLVGNVRLAQGDTASALESYRAALDIRERLVARDPTNAAWQSDLSGAHGKIGNVRLAQGDTGSALQSYRTSLEIHRRLVARDRANAQWRSELSNCYHDVGVVLHAQGDAEAALASYRSSLEIRRRLAVEDPTNADWQLDLAGAYAAVGDVRLAQGDVKSALESHRLGLDIRKRLAAEDPTNANRRRRLSVGLNDVGDVLRAQGDLKSALESYRAGLDIAQRLADQDPTNAIGQRDLACSLEKVGVALRRLGNAGAALENYRASLEIKTRLATQDSTNAERQRDLAGVLAAVGDTLLTQGDAKSALESCRASLEIQKRLAAQDPANALRQRDVAVHLSQVGHVLVARGDRESALESYRAGLEIRERVAAGDPTNAERRRDLSVGHQEVARVLSSLGKTDSALASYRNSLQISEALAARDQTIVEWQRDLVVALGGIGDILYAQGDPEAALTSYRASRDISRRVAAQAPAGASRQRDLAVVHGKVGKVLLAQGDAESALTSYRAAVEISKRLVALDPTNAGWQRALSIGHYNVGRVLEVLRRYEESARSFRRAEALHEAVVERAPHYSKEHGKWVRRRRRAELLTGEQSPETAADHLELVYAHYRAEEFAASAVAFEKALRDDAVRKDLKRGYLYNAACVAALAVKSGKGDTESFRANALAWLAADVALRRELLAKIEEFLAAGKGDGARLVALKDATLEHLRKAATDDPHLDAIRGTPEFAELFE